MACNTSLKSEPVWFIKGSIGMEFWIKPIVFTLLKTLPQLNSQNDNLSEWNQRKQM